MVFFGYSFVRYRVPVMVARPTRRFYNTTHFSGNYCEIIVKLLLRYCRMIAKLVLIYQELLHDNIR
jgi:hypothetical protein